MKEYLQKRLAYLRQTLVRVSHGKFEDGDLSAEFYEGAIDEAQKALDYLYAEKTSFQSR